MSRIKNWKKGYNGSELVEWVRKDGLVIKAKKEKGMRPWKLRVDATPERSRKWRKNEIIVSEQTKSDILDDASEFQRDNKKLETDKVATKYRIA